VVASSDWAALEVGGAFILGAVVTAIALIQLTKVVVAMVEDRHRRRDRRDDDEERQ
jgi:hypothetical protein